MNRRITKKHEKYHIGVYFSSYHRKRSLKLAKHAALVIQQCRRSLIPDTDTYTKFLKKRRTIGRLKDENGYNAKRLKSLIIPQHVETPIIKPHVFPQYLINTGGDK